MLFVFPLLCYVAGSISERELLFPTENTVPTLPETPDSESSLYFFELCALLCDRCYVNIYIFYIFIIKYIHSSQSADIQLLLL